MAIEKITVFGAGNMGSGIAQAWAQGGFQVQLHDLSEEAIQNGLARIEKPLRKRVEAGRMAAEEVDAIMANLHAAPDFEAAVSDADMVIEAVFEDLQVKQDLFARLDGACPEKTVLATNTSSFLVADLAAKTNRPDRCVGLHYFFPAAINKLVEVIQAETTDRRVFNDVYAAVRRTGKIPIETADASGFAVNRFFVPWINESCRILEEGVANVATIEVAAKEAFQIGMGPFELMNVTGVPISLHAQSTLHAAFGPFYEPAQILRDQVDAKQNWELGGDVDDDKKAAVASRLRAVVYAVATSLVDEGVATIMDTDRGATIGLRWAKGPFAMMNDQGWDGVKADVVALAQKWGDDFPKHESLHKQIASGEPWHLPSVNCQIDGGIALITFDRPEAMNALDRRVLSDLDLCLDKVEANGGVRAIVVTGAAKAFIAGADIPTMNDLDMAGVKEYTDFGNGVLNRLAGQACPVIMAINGYAFGGGLELALCGDLLYASDKAQLGLPEVGLGIHPGFGGTQRLPRRIGVGAAKELIYTGRTIGPEEALDLGLVNGIVPHADLLDEVMGIAKQIAKKAPLAVAGAKTSIDQGLGTDLRGGLAVEQESVILLFDTKDKAEGLGAFMERRKPQFVGQ